MKLWWTARFPHYRRHLALILDGLAREGVELVEGVGEVTLCAGLPDVDRCPSDVILVEHGAGQTYVIDGQRVDPSGSLIPKPMVRLYLAPSQRMADHMAAKLPNARRVAVGSPVVERLAQRVDGSGDRVGFAVHWPSPIRVKEAGTSWPWSARILRALHGFYGERLVTHSHPRFAHRFIRELRRHQFRDVEFVEDWDELARGLACLVVDNSSIIWEANAAGIPVVLIEPPFWQPDTHGLRFGEEAAGFRRIDSPESAITATEAAILDGRAVRVAGVYERVEGATGAAVDAIMEWLDNRI